MDQALRRWDQRPCTPSDGNLCLGGGRFKIEATWRDAQGNIGTGTALCLDSSRFRVQVAWDAPDGTSGQGHAVSLTTDSGYFWFFSAGDIELVVKVLDACALNQRQWVFATGLTNVQVVLTVTDTKNGAVKVYENPQGLAFQPILDTGAFPNCP